MRRLLSMVCAGLLLCGAARPMAVHTLSPGDADRLLSEGGVYLIDIRPTKEYSAGHIPSAASIPASEFSRHTSDLPSDKTQPVLVYCRLGDQSGSVAHRLYRMGYKDVYVLQGGIRAWTTAQKPIQVQPPDVKAPGHS